MYMKDCVTTPAALCKTSNWIIQLGITLEILKTVLAFSFAVLGVLKVVCDYMPKVNHIKLHGLVFCLLGSHYGQKILSRCLNQSGVMQQPSFHLLSCILLCVHNLTLNHDCLLWYSWSPLFWTLRGNKKQKRSSKEPIVHNWREKPRGSYGFECEISKFKLEGSNITILSCNWPEAINFDWFLFGDGH